MKNWQRKILIVFGVVALVSYWIVGLWILSPAFALIAASPLPAPLWTFAISTTLLLADLTAWSVLILHWSWSSPVHLSTRERRVSAIKKIAVVVFSQLVLWFRVMLEIVLPVMLPSLELWFVALALAWMATPFTSMGWMYIGMRLGSWFDKRG